jgi:hypothetical protein
MVRAAHRAAQFNNALLTRAACVHATGSWSVEANNSLGASHSFLFSSLLDFPSSSSNSSFMNGTEAQSAFSLQFFVFANRTTINLGATAGEEIAFEILPAYVKFTLAIDNWRWQSADDISERAVVRVAIQPRFTGFTEVVSTDKHVREFVLTGQTGQSYAGGSASTRLRLVEAVTVDGVLEVASTRNSTDGAVRFELDTSTSEVVLSFRRFNSSLVYDPGTHSLMMMGSVTTADTSVARL